MVGVAARDEVHEPGLVQLDVGDVAPVHAALLQRERAVDPEGHHAVGFARRVQADHQLQAHPATPLQNHRFRWGEVVAPAALGTVLARHVLAGAALADRAGEVAAAIAAPIASHAGVVGVEEELALGVEVQRRVRIAQTVRPAAGVAVGRPIFVGARARDRQEVMDVFVVLGQADARPEVELLVAAEAAAGALFSLARTIGERSTLKAGFRGRRQVERPLAGGGQLRVVLQPDPMGILFVPLQTAVAFGERRTIEPGAPPRGPALEVLAHQPGGRRRVAFARRDGPPGLPLDHTDEAPQPKGAHQGDRRPSSGARSGVSGLHRASRCHTRRRGASRSA